MPDAAYPVIGAVVAFVGVVYATWTRDRNNPMAQTVDAANTTTAQMQAFIAPLLARVETSERSIGELTAKVATLEGYVTTLQEQIRSLGAEPIPFASHQQYRVPKPGDK